MSRLTVLAACGVLTLSALPAAAQDWPRQPATIDVIGHGQAQAAPDRFSMSASVHGRGATQVEALRNLTEAQTRVTTAVTRLRGLTWVEFSTGEPVVRPVYEADCESRGYGRQDSCQVEGYVATLPLMLQGAPAERAGDAVSITAERGAREARLDGYRLGDESPLRREATRAAFADARRQADIIAEASGQRIVRVTTVAHPRLDEEAAYVPPPAMLSGAIDFEEPTVPVSVSPRPIRIDAQLAVTFEVE
jgi:uncharacterized protein YggE